MIQIGSGSTQDQGDETAVERKPGTTLFCFVVDATMVGDDVTIHSVPRARA